MSRTFEEQVSEELDALYQGALFLLGGEARPAARLTLEAVELACAEDARGQGGPVGRWLEACLARAFVQQAGAAHGVGRGGADDVGPVKPQANMPEQFGPDDLFRAASAVPALPRLALWLVLLRRWNYDEAAATMGLGGDELRAMLRHRGQLLAELTSASRGKRRISGLES